MFGVDLKTIQELMGHKDVRMILRYSHLSYDHKGRILDIFGKKLDTF
jgi:site-specific recombinase XerD